MSSFSNFLAIKKEEKEEKEELIFSCQKCDFKCSNKYNWDRHLSTRKHSKVTVGNTKEQTNYNCEHCNKIYESKNGLWRHKKKCNIICETENTLVIATSMPNNEEIIIQLLNQNKEILKEQTDIKQIILEIVKNGTTNNSNNNIISNSNINSHNKTFNLQVFLNETCKDAMNISEFVDTIKIELADLMELGKVGYAEGISKIIVKNLNAMNEIERPIHCTDKKREIFYIKDENKWEKESEDLKKLRKIIFRISNKNIKMLQIYKDLHPGCNFSASKFADQYSKLVIEAMGGAGDNDKEKEDKIIRNISRSVTIKKLPEGAEIV
jgi:hypothetical protein